MKTHTLTECLGAVLIGAALQAQAGNDKIGKTKVEGGVDAANPRSGSPENVIADGLTLSLIAQGSDPLENPSDVIQYFGYLANGILTLPPLPPIDNPGVASKTEPDENTYLELDQNPGGPTEGYDYGRRFLFQGHENAGDLAFVTRINLDVTDPAHRITLLTPVGDDKKTHFNRIDGSVFNPFTQTLLFTQENGNAGGVIEI